MLQLHSLRKLIIQSNSDGNISFVFVSEWMKKMTEQDTLIRVINFKVIPNPINIHLFNFIPKDNEQRKRILVLRPFHSRKYAADVIALSIEKLIKYDWFHELNFTIVGGGLKSSKLYQLVKNLENVKAEDRFLTQTEIKDLHADHGIFLCPTRQDAQGVSMCEAMASGLVPISTNNTAIPEFVKDKFSGMLTNNKPVEIIKIIEQLFFDPGLFQYLSKNAAESIVKKAGIEKVIINEVRLIESTS